MATEYEKSKQKAEESLAALYEADTVGGEFNDSSISRYAGFGLNGETDEPEKKKKIDAEAERAAQQEYDAWREREMAQAVQERETARLTTAQTILKARHQASLRGAGKMASRKAVGRFASVIHIGGVWTVYSVQVFFALVSLAFLGAAGAVAGLKENWFIGAILKVIGAVAGLFTDVQSFAPLEAITLAFWALSTLLVFISYFVSLLIFQYTADEETFGSPQALLITLGVFALSIIPVTNIVPWIPLWVIYVNAQATLNLLVKRGVDVRGTKGVF